MPPVRTLVNNTAPKAADAEFGFGANAPAAPTAVAPAPAAPAGELALPSWLNTAPAIPETGASRTAYVASASTRSNKWESQKAAGCADGDFYLEHAGAFFKVTPLRFFTIQAHAFRTDMDDQGTVTAVTRDMNDRKLDEHFVALILADVNGTLMPAKWEPRRTKSGALSPILQALKLAASPGFAGLSDAHRVAAAFPAPWGRIVGTATPQARVAKGSGRKYIAAVGSYTPTPLADLKRLSDALARPEFIAEVESVRESVRQRVEQFETMAG